MTELGGDMTMTTTAASAIQNAKNPRTVLRRGWHLDGPGPARWGWAYQHPCKVEYVGRTLAIAIARADATAKDLDRQWYDAGAR
jgi:hypothetical protein